MSSHPLASEQQSISDSKPRDPGQLFEPHARPIWQSSCESQSPSSMLQGLSVVQPSSSTL